MYAISEFVNGKWALICLIQGGCKHFQFLNSISGHDLGDWFMFRAAGSCIDHSPLRMSNDDEVFEAGPQ